MEIKCYLPRDLFDSIERRCNALNISKSEYLRLLASLDIYNINYQNVLQYFEILNYQNLIVSAILILFVPRNIKIPIEDLIGRNKLLTNIGENRLNENREMAEKLNTLSNTILENIEKEEPKLQNIEEEFVQTFLDNMATNYI